MLFSHVNAKCHFSVPSLQLFLVFFWALAVNTETTVINVSVQCRRCFSMLNFNMRCVAQCIYSVKSCLGDSTGLTVLIALCSTLNKIWKPKEMQIFSHLLFNLKSLCKTVKYRMQVRAPQDRDHFWKVFMASILPVNKEKVNHIINWVLCLKTV